MFFPSAKLSTNTNQSITDPHNNTSPQRLIPTVTQQSTQSSDQHVSENIFPTSEHITSPISSGHTSPLSADQPVNNVSLLTNTHGMQIRSKSGIFKPKMFNITKEPTTVEEALQFEH